MRPEQLLNQFRRYMPNRCGDSDDELLERFIAKNDQNAFANLLDRYAAMVMGVCQRIVGELHLAEDVFQATFLVLSKKAASLRQTKSLPAWLHSVAFRLALQMRKSSHIRLSEGRRMERSEKASPLDELCGRELMTILDEELNRLSERHRTVLILCCMEGHSQEEAARFLGCSSGSIKGCLERARTRLREKLAQRGLMFSSIFGARLMFGSCDPVAASTLKKTLASIACGCLPEPRVAALVEMLLRSSFSTNLKIAALSLSAICGLMYSAVALSTEGNLVQTATPIPAEVGKQETLPFKTDLYGDPLPDGAIMRLGTLQRRATGAQMAFTRDGKSIVTVRGERYVTVWDAETGKSLATRTLAVRHAKQGWISPDGRWLSRGGMNPGTLNLVDLQTGKTEHNLAIPESNSIGAVGYSPGGDRIAAVCSIGVEKLVKVWDIATEKELLSQALPTTCSSSTFIAFTPSGKDVVAAFPQMKIGSMCWNIATNKLLWQSDKRCGSAPVFTPDARFMLLQGNEGLDLQSLASVAFAKMPHREWDSRLCFLPDGKRLVFSKRGGIVVWDWENGRELHFLKDAGEEFVLAPDGKSIMTNDGSLQRWNLETGKPIYADTFQAGHIREVVSIKFTADGRRLASASKDGSVRLWDATTGKPINVWKGHEAYRSSPLKKWFDAGVQALDITPDGRWIISGGSEEKLIVRDVVTRQNRSIELPLPESGASEQQIYQLRISPDGREAVAVFGATLFDAVAGQPIPQPMNKVACWDLRTGKLLRPIGSTSASKFCDLDASRRIIVRQKILEDVAAGKLIGRLEGDSTSVDSHLAFSSDGSNVIGTLTKEDNENGIRTIGFGGLRVWESWTGKTIGDFSAKSWVGQVGFHPNQRLAFFNDYDGITLYDLAAKRVAFQRSMPETIPSSTTRGSCASCVAFSPDGSKMATGLPDGTILIWEVPISLSRLEVSDSKTVEAMWTLLESPDAAKAWELIWRLQEAPDELVLPALQSRLRKVPSLSLGELRPDIAELDHPVFAKREQASKRLREMGLPAEAALREVGSDELSVEQSRRIDEILAAIRDPRLPLRSKELAELRALSILERLRTPESKKLLEELSKGAPSARLTRAAKGALERAQ